MRVKELAAQPIPCSGCGAQIAPTLLVCPVCKGLVHAEELKRLAAQASQAAEAGDPVSEILAWREAAVLLPEGSTQRAVVLEKISTLSAKIDAAGLRVPAPGEGGQATQPGAPKKESRFGKWAAGAGALGALALKFKMVIVFVLTKAKLLLFGLGKMGTLSTMLLSLGLYWSMWGWKFALGLIASIYVHEMGHVATLKRFGIPASAPMFIPGLGAVVRLKQYPMSVRESARTGLAGPIWGLFAAVAAYGVFLVTRQPIWAAIAQVGAWINLFNLLPVWQLDGGRGFESMTRNQRLAAVVAIAAMWAYTGEGLLVMLGVLGLVMAFSGKTAREPDQTALTQYVMLVVLLSLLCTLPIPHSTM